MDKNGFQRTGIFLRYAHAAPKRRAIPAREVREIPEIPPGLVRREERFFPNWRCLGIAFSSGPARSQVPASGRLRMPRKDLIPPSGGSLSTPLAPSTASATNSRSQVIIVGSRHVQCRVQPSHGHGRCRHNAHQRPKDRHLWEQRLVRHQGYGNRLLCRRSGAVQRRHPGVLHSVGAGESVTLGGDPGHNASAKPQPGQRPKSDRLAPEVLELPGQGRSYRLIGRRLRLSQNTVVDTVKRSSARSE